ncbi:DUF3047 domain-containing protein [Methylomonas rosea]|uniref:DUF3047 domain-containing protein n=1 Tax=Methylomonas rosea TaxID=2952227 RepID=A0ABT1TPY3_9GAMM|nr:DUF3047 domain-containing protein [Methylomonas sp. WSC-7]MCQ8116088.1 DUF3047 domain-containing protein [Methylomonas sp. WSC-7]
MHLAQSLCRRSRDDVSPRDPEASLNVWLKEKRNGRADLPKLFGDDISYIDAVALMADADNSGGQASAYYGDIWFSKD